MKIKYILAGCFALYLKVKAQNADTTYYQRQIPKTEIEAVFSYYNQDGNHSAVTGGIGTERLNVYASNIDFTRSFKGRNAISFKAGTDIITSASTDKIDNVVSSASKKDARTHANIFYKRDIKETNLSVGLGTGFSIESDYFSWPLNFSMEYKSPEKLRTYNLDINAYYDDLRWGRLNPDYYKPVNLLYPSELKYVRWFDIYRRNSYNINLGITQIVNKRLIVGFFPGLIYQKGLLSTPFHRVYFNDNTLKVENLPQERLKIPLGIKVNYFAASKLILKANLGYYWDSFNIDAKTLEIESAYKASPIFTISPFIRIYAQNAAKYFSPYMNHSIDSEYYTSDYDLAAFQSLKAGVNFRYLPIGKTGKNWLFNEVNLRYAYYKRTDGLYAHIVTVSFRIDKL